MRTMILEWTGYKEIGSKPTIHREIVEVLAVEKFQEVDTGRLLRIMHTRFSQCVQRGRYFNYLGTKFLIESVSDSKKLQGLELVCVPIPEALPADEVAAYRDYLRKLAF